jgi:hypothetical protein
MPKSIDYTGQTFGKLTALHFTGKYFGKSRKRIWLYQCSCGKTTETLSEKVVAGWTTSCGCAKGQYTGARSTAYQVYGEHYADGDLTFAQFEYLTRQPCYWCGKFNMCRRKHRTKKDLFFSYHGLDRLDNSRVHDYDNVVPCCWPCNDLRKNRSVQQFVSRIDSIYWNRVSSIIPNYGSGIEILDEG